MKLSKKLKRQLKQKLITAVASTATVITLVAAGNQAGLFASFNQLVGINETTKSMPNEYSLTSENVANTGRLSNTATTTYIYNVADLVAFRDAVNAGDLYEGKTVQLMNDIDLSTVCSSTLAVSWTPIGYKNNVFAGTFEGNYHTISNLYIDTNTALYMGLFAYNNGTIQNLIMDNVYIYNRKSSVEIGIITASNSGKMINCGINSGSITGEQTANVYNYVGGVAGANYGLMSGCYNRASVTVISGGSGSSSHAIAGGITSCTAHIAAIMENCYNAGTISATGSSRSIGGVVGIAEDRATLRNSYNYGTISTSGSKYIGGIMGRDAGGSYSSPTAILSNNYCTTDTPYAYIRYSNSSGVTTGRTAHATLKTYAVKLGSAFAYDVYDINNGYPVLAWQNETTVMQLDQNQAYIKVGGKLPLNIQANDAVSKKIGNNYSPSNFTWKSTNEDVATVDNRGIVTGLSDGYTTIYAHHEASNLYAMCVVNVATDIANPQIGTGNGFTVILKADGTVWTIGNNEIGQLGNGTTTNSKIPVQVKIDEDTVLSQVIKIAVGNEHTLALTKNGNVYAWGKNSTGQLGQNNTSDMVYAKLVLAENGTNYLGNIVDIAAGTQGSSAIDYNGNVYVWGNGSYGEIGNYENDSKNLPTRIGMKQAIKIDMGYAHIAVLTSEGAVWTWGRNVNGELGINCQSATSYPMKSAFDVTEIATSSYHTNVKKIDGTVYASGGYYLGQLGIQTNKNVAEYTKVDLPSTVTKSNKVKYIKGGRTNTNIVLTDGTVWQTGYNGNGELGNGSTTDSSVFVQGLTAKETPVKDVLTVGKNLGDPSIDTVKHAQNTAVILKNGDIYTTGDNTYGQVGDNTTDNTNYYKKMGFAYLEYEDKEVELAGESSYQIDTNKLKYTSHIMNVYHEQNYSIGTLKYISSNKEIATIDENGKVVGQQEATGATKITIQDITNHFETNFSVIVNRLKNTDTVTYIYTAEDMARFRDAVNAGDNYKDKTAYLMNDIDLSSVCSKELDISWTPIGTGKDEEKISFEGTFDGNYHTISNLYIDNNTNLYMGLFSYNAGTIQNLILDHVSIYQREDSKCIGGVTATNRGRVINCGVDNGKIIGEQKNANIYTYVGGVVGDSSGSVSGCYNGADISSTCHPTARSSHAIAGGVVGATSHKEAIVENCYNRGTISGAGYHKSVGGVIGIVENKASFNNSYSYGTILCSGKSYAGGFAGRNGGGNGSGIAGYMNNNYCTTEPTYSYVSYANGQGYTTGKTPSDTLKTYSTTLGNAYRDDNYNINNGYPILWWQAPSMELNQKQVYIQTGESIQLTIIQNEKAKTIFGREAKMSDFVWNSYNQDVATVNNNGLVTGLTDGYTTIYGYNAEHNIYVVCVVNVAKKIANPQIETGEGFTAILKPDGTVWTLGNNHYGQLGNGTNDEKMEAEQVKISENTDLTNVIKIAVGTNHVLALTQNGQVYSWGDNRYGQLGQHNQENSNYAKLVLGEGGSGTLNKIVDISAGNYGSAAVNEFGWVFIWGNGSYGEMGNLTTANSDTPVKSILNTATQISMGAGHIGTITQDSTVYTWGRNNYGQLGIGNTNNANMVTRIGEVGAQISCAGYEIVGINLTESNNIYFSGLNNYQQLGSGDNITKLTKVTLPTSVLGTSRMKYVKAGRTTSNILLSDGRVFTLGSNLKGELGAGQEANVTGMLQGKAKEGELEPIITIGRSSGENATQNTVVIGESGRVYTAGDNTYGQIGNHTKDNQNYFTVMGYPTIHYESIIRMYVGETKQLTSDDFAYVEKYFNIYREDKISHALADKAKILDSNIVTYEDGLMTANRIGSTILIAKEEEKDILVYIPVEVLPENATVLPNSQAGENFTVGLRYNGTIWTFGTNTKGELGIGNNIDRNVPMQVKIKNTGEAENITIDKKIKQISVGISHTLVLTEDGEVYSWGANHKGQLGIGNTKNSNLPQKVEIPESTALYPMIKENVIKVIASRNTSYAILQDGKVYAWGETWGTTPKLLTTDYDIVDISNTYALDTEGNVYTRQDRVAIVEKIKYISESDTHTVFLSENGTAYAIGSNTFGQFGDGTNVSSLNNVVAVRNEDMSDVLRDIVKIEAGSGYTVALLSDDRVMEWGKNKDGQLGTDEVGEINTVRENEYLTKLTSETAQTVLFLDAGANHVVTTLNEGNVYLWGLGENGEFGNGTNISSIQPQKAGKDIVKANSNHLILYPNDTFDLEASIFYFNLLQEIGGEILYESKDETVVTVDEITGRVTAIQPGMTVIVAKETGTSNIAVIQVRVLPKGVKVEPQVATNGSHTVTLKGNGTVWCYGNNTNGECRKRNNKLFRPTNPSYFPRRNHDYTSRCRRKLFCCIRQ